MWSFGNPVKIHYGVRALEQLSELLHRRRYCLVTYNEPVFQALGERIQSIAGAPVLTVNDINPNPDFDDLSVSCANYGDVTPAPEVILAVGGGSVMDAAKVLAAANGDFDRVKCFLESLSLIHI